MTQRKPKRSKELGVTDAEYERLLAAQGGTCALCSNVPKRLKKDGTPYRLHVDHDHGSPDHRVRGLLCWKCNDALRTWVDTEWLARALLYMLGLTDASIVVRDAADEYATVYGFRKQPV